MFVDFLNEIWFVVCVVVEDYFCEGLAMIKELFFNYVVLSVGECQIINDFIVKEFWT